MENKQPHSQHLTDNLISYFSQNLPIYSKAITENYENNKEEFLSLSEKMLDWAHQEIGDTYLDVLTKGYRHFVNDVNKSQLKYEKRKSYQNKTYKQVFETVYGNADHMQYYHWGVYLTTFAWEHHLAIYNFFERYYISLLEKEGRLLDLGSGSGIWTFLTLDILQNWKSLGIDISEYSVDIASKMAQSIGLNTRAGFTANDALTFSEESKFDSVISCFLMEHLETPDKLLENISNNLKVGGYGFVTAALTAAEVDHIYEFKKESEIIMMAEDAGLRVISSFSSAPKKHSLDSYFLPRSMAIVVQKKKNEIW